MRDIWTKESIIMKVLALAFALGLAASGTAWAAGDAAAGADTARVCKACHNWGPGATNKIGPVLNGVVGRQPGTYPGFSYSNAMIEFGKQNPAWTPELLATYLHGPRTVVPGTKMTFAGFPDQTDADNVVAFLQTLKADGSTGGGTSQ
jgi:cytochrome c